jgi:hypothetical protein
MLNAPPLADKARKQEVNWLSSDGRVWAIGASPHRRGERISSMPHRFLSKCRNRS